MNTAKAASDVLHRAEVELAKIATSAASERDYAFASKLLALAQNLAATAKQLGPTDNADASPAKNGQSEPKSSSAKAPSTLPDAGDETTAGYPKFERENDQLVKLGLSKSDNSIYEHKCPRRTVDLLVDAIRRSATKKGEFRTDRILPLTDDTGAEIPAYQAYLSLAWLRQIGVVNRVARQRYSLAPNVDISSTIEASWNALHQRQ